MVGGAQVGIRAEQAAAVEAAVEALTPFSARPRRRRSARLGGDGGGGSDAGGGPSRAASPPSTVRASPPAGEAPGRGRSRARGGPAAPASPRGGRSASRARSPSRAAALRSASRSQSRARSEAGARSGAASPSPSPPRAPRTPRSAAKSLRAAAPRATPAPVRRVAAALGPLPARDLYARALLRSLRWPAAPALAVYLARLELRVLAKWARVVGAVPTLASPLLAGLLPLALGVVLLPLLPGALRELWLLDAGAAAGALRALAEDARARGWDGTLTRAAAGVPGRVREGARAAGRRARALLGGGT